MWTSRVYHCKDSNTERHLAIFNTNPCFHHVSLIISLVSSPEAQIPGESSLNLSGTFFHICRNWSWRTAAIVDLWVWSDLDAAENRIVNPAAVVILMLCFNHQKHPKIPPEIPRHRVWTCPPAFRLRLKTAVTRSSRGLRVINEINPTASVPKPCGPKRWSSCFTSQCYKIRTNHCQLLSQDSSFPKETNWTSC